MGGGGGTLKHVCEKVLGFKSTVLNARGAYGPLTLCNFLDNLSRSAVARQVAGELHSVTWVVSQFFFFFFCSNWQHHCTVYHPSSNFTADMTRAHGHTSYFSFRGALQNKLLRKLQCTEQGLNTKPRQLATRYIFNHCQTSCRDNCVV